MPQFIMYDFLNDMSSYIFLNQWVMLPNLFCWVTKQSPYLKTKKKTITRIFRKNYENFDGKKSKF